MRGPRVSRDEIGAVDYDVGQLVEEQLLRDTVLGRVALDEAVDTGHERTSARRDRRIAGLREDCADPGAQLAGTRGLARHAASDG